MILGLNPRRYGNGRNSRLYKSKIDLYIIVIIKFKKDKMYSYSSSTLRSIARSDYWSPEDARHLRRIGGPVQTSNVLTSIFENIYNLETLMNPDIVKRKSGSDCCRDFNRSFNSLLYTYENTCIVYSSDAIVELKDFEAKSLKDKRYYSCYPLMKEMTECLDKAYNFWENLEYNEKYPLFIDKLDNKKALKLLTWWKSVLSANGNVYPEEPKFECKEWERRNKILQEYLPVAREGKNPIAHLEDYL
jgi:hypothetical protein